MIELIDVGFTYPGALEAALRGVSLTLAAGETVAVVGANGSGKSTLACLCDGLLSPDEGAVAVDGIDTRDESRVRDVRSRVGLVMQNPDDQIVGTVVEEDVAFGPENLCVPRDELRLRVDESLASVGLTGSERREPHLLSQGQKQRLAIAGALAMRPAYLVLDEPTALLDPCGRADVLAVLDRLAARGTGILHVTHDLADAARADRIVALSRGAVAFDGDIGGLLADEELLGSLGLRIPPIAILARSLRGLGVPVPPDAMSAESVVAALWP